MAENEKPYFNAKSITTVKKFYGKGRDVIDALTGSRHIGNHRPLL